jgi:hypothetical protein
LEVTTVQARVFIRKIALAAFAGVVVGLGLAVPQAASAAPVAETRVESTVGVTEGPIRIRNRATGRCLEGNHGGHVYTAPCNQSSYQGWIYTPGSNGWATIKNWQLNWCLDGNNGRVYGLGCNGGNYQKWVFHRSTSNRIGHNATPTYLDGNHEGSVYLSPANNGEFQKWDFIGY